MSDLLSHLNPVQQEAVRHKDGPLLVLAGAGSGKTRIIIYRVAYLIEQGVLPQQIMAVTFTNKAAQEMSERVNTLLGISGNDVWVATIHSTCAHILRRDIEELGLGTSRTFSIIDAADQASIIKRCMKELNISQHEIQPSFYAHIISQRKNDCFSENPWQDREDYHTHKLEEMWTLYHKRLLESNCLDFDDLLRHTYTLFLHNETIRERYQRRWRYQMIDEFQDINTLQYEIIKLLASKHHNLCVVGDDDQSIYRWRGAEVENILSFDLDFPDTKIIVLDQNYRSTKTIIQAASFVSSKITLRREKKLWTDNVQGSRIGVYLAQNEYDEAHYCLSTIKDFYQRDHYNWDDFAILYRTNAQSRILEEKLMESAIPYYLIGEVGFYKRREIKDLLAYLNLIVDPLHQAAFMRVINVPSRGIGQKTLDRISEYAQDHGLPLLSVIADKEFLAELTPKTRTSLVEFSQLITTCYDLTREKGACAALKHLIQSVDYMTWLERENAIQAQSRLENIAQLHSALESYQGSHKSGNYLLALQSFLEKAALASEADDYERKSEKVALMTLHCAKGLEFPIVFIAGMVEGLLPHSRSLQDEAGQIDEERRLCYVGITRARRHLFLTAPMSRRYFGHSEMGLPSRFISDIPEKLVTLESHHELPLYKPRSGPSLFYPARPAPRKDKPSRSPVKAIDALLPGPETTSKRKNQPGFRLGSRVRHPRWGDGMVIQMNGSGDRLKLLVSFPGFGNR